MGGKKFSIELLSNSKGANQIQGGAETLKETLRGIEYMAGLIVQV